MKKTLNENYEIRNLDSWGFVQLLQKLFSKNSLSGDLAVRGNISTDYYYFAGIFWLCGDL